MSLEIAVFSKNEAAKFELAVSENRQKSFRRFPSQLLGLLSSSTATYWFYVKLLLPSDS